MDTKKLAFAIMMGALGNVLFLVSYYAGPITQGVALDFSLVGVFIAGLYGGPIAGIISGFIAGIMPGVMFGPLGSGGALGLIGLPIGKALTGLTTGLLSQGLKIPQRAHSSLVTIPTTLIAYVPEALFTFAYFSYMLPLFLSQNLGTAVITTIMIKAIAEVAIMSVIMATLMGNNGFNSFIRAHFTKMENKERLP
jgi:LytS/YehU family sensor histidine kinase